MPGVKNQRGLTPEMEAFCHEYLIDLNAGAAATRAGYASSNPKYASRRGNEVLKNPKVIMRIQELMDQRAHVTDVTAERVVMELARIGFSDLRDIVSWGAGGAKWKASDEISDEAAAVVKEIYETEREMDDGGVYRTKRIQMHDKMAALKELAKHTGVGQGDRGIQSQIKDEVERQKAGDFRAMFAEIDNWRSEQEKALPEERLNAERLEESA